MTQRRKKKVKKSDPEENLPEDSPEKSALRAKVAKYEEEKATFAQRANLAAQIPGSGFTFGAVSVSTSAAPLSFVNPSQGMSLKPNYFKKQRFSSSFLFT